MKLIKRLWQKTILYQSYDLINSTKEYLKDMHYVNDTFHSDALKLVFKKYINLDVKEDWIGRLYGVINPDIDIDGKFNPNNIIIELDGDNTNNDEYVKHYVHKQLRLIGELFKINNLYDYISVDFKHVGPVNMDNYLIVFDITSRKWFAYALKHFLLHLLILGILAIVLVVCL